MRCVCCVVLLCSCCCCCRQVADFGLSRMMCEGATHLSTHTVGTITHQPPGECHTFTPYMHTAIRCKNSWRQQQLQTTAANIDSWCTLLVYTVTQAVSIACDVWQSSCGMAGLQNSCLLVAHAVAPVLQRLDFMLLQHIALRPMCCCCCFRC
jgi:hypothetical protein